MVQIFYFQLCFGFFCFPTHRSEYIPFFTSTVFLQLIFLYVCINAHNLKEDTIEKRLLLYMF